MSAELRVTTPQSPRSAGAEGLTVERFRTMVQDTHVNFLIGAGTPSSFFGQLGDIEHALTLIDTFDVPEAERQLARASIQGYFFRNVLLPNQKLIPLNPDAIDVVTSYAKFLKTLNHVLLLRRSSLLSKQANIFTTNVDMVFEVALEQLGVEVIDGFSGKIRPQFDLGEFGSSRFRQTARYERRSEIPVIDLYKLHGSAGWRVEQTDGLTERIYYDHGLRLIDKVRAAYELATADLLPIESAEGLKGLDILDAAKGKAVSAAVTAFTTAYNELAIVNPEKTKFATTVLNETYYELIRRLANELEKENSLLLVHGFSFRDEHIRDLVLRAARTNPTLQVIVFCYRRSDRDDYEALFPDAEVKNSNVSFVAPFEPKDGEEELVLDLDRLHQTYFKPLTADPVPVADQVIALDIRAIQDPATNA